MTVTKQITDHVFVPRGERRMISGNQYQDSFVNLSEDERALLRHLHMAGDGARTIAAALEVSAPTVRRWFRLLGVPSHPTGRPATRRVECEDEEVFELEDPAHA